MWLDLKDVIGIPGAKAPFECEISEDGLKAPAVTAFIEMPKAVGSVVNTAGALTLTGEMTAKMSCLCDRCGRAFEKSRIFPLSLKLAADMEDDDDPEIFPVTGNGVDLDELLRTCFILDMDTKYLCSDNCKGLCGVCGKNLNDGPCSCAKQTDPRLAVLGQLLDIDDK